MNKWAKINIREYINRYIKKMVGIIIIEKLIIEKISGIVSKISKPLCV